MDFFQSMPPEAGVWRQSVWETLTSLQFELLMLDMDEIYLTDTVLVHSLGYNPYKIFLFPQVIILQDQKQSPAFVNYDNSVEAIKLDFNKIKLGRILAQDCPQALLQHLHKRDRSPAKANLSDTSSPFKSVQRFSMASAHRQLSPEKMGDHLQKSSEMDFDVYFITVYSSLKESVADTFYFKTKQSFQRWRKTLAKMNIVNTNFLQKYIMQTKLEDRGYTTAVEVSKARNGKKYIAVSFLYKILGRFPEPRGIIYNQIEIYRKLGGLPYFSHLRELQSHENRLFLIFSQADGPTLTQYYYGRLSNKSGLAAVYPILR